MADSGPRGRRAMLCSYIVEHAVAINFLIMGFTGVISCGYFVRDDEWKITSVSYFFVLFACAVVCLTCKRGNLYYRNIEEDLNRRKANRSRPNSKVVPQPVQDNESLPLLSSLRASDRCVTNDNPSFSSSGLMEDSFRSIKEPLPTIEDRNVVVADVHQTSEDSDQTSPKPASPEENESSSSNAVKSDPQKSTSTPDSGVALQTSQSPPTSAEEQDKPSPPDPK